MKHSIVILTALAAISTSPLAKQTQLTEVEMVTVKGGEYLMGSLASKFERQKDETQHRVKVNDFILARYEVSQKLYRKVMSNNPYAHQNEELPVENVSWFEGARFCNVLSKREGLAEAYLIREKDGDPKVSWNRSANGYRLPTKSEWECAARAASTSPFNTGENINADHANFYGKYPNRDVASQLYRTETVPVTVFSANA